MDVVLHDTTRLDVAHRIGVLTSAAKEWPATSCFRRRGR